MRKFYSLIIFALMAITASAQDDLNPEAGLQTVPNYRVERNGFAVVWGQIAPENSSAASQVDFNDDGTVVFKIVPKSGHDGYVTGTKEGDKITVRFPQAVGSVYDEWTEETTEVYADVLNYEKIDGYDWYVSSGQETVLEFTLDEDGTFSFDLKGDDDAYFAQQIIGIVGDLDPQSNSWTGFGDWAATYAPFNQQPLALPQGVEAEQWVLNHEYETRSVQVAIDGNDIYLGNLSDELPSSFVKGTIDGDKVRFPLTYMGYSFEAENFVFFVPCAWEEIYFEQWDEYLEDYVIQPEYVFDYDAEARTLSCIDEFSAIMVGTSDKVGELAGSYIEYYFEPSLQWLNPESADAPLMDPEFVTAYHDDWYDCDFIEYFIPAQNEENYPLDTDRLSYQFYLDGKPFTFTTDKYEGLDEDMTLVPFDFCDEWNQDIWSYGQDHQLCLYNESYSTVGLKVFYAKDDGTVAESNYVEADIEVLSEGSITAGISNAQTAVSTVQYYDLQGRAINRPTTGLSIKLTRYADGTRKLHKQLAR